MIERVIRSIGDVSMKTREKFYPLTPGEVLKAQFRDEKEYNRLLRMNIFEPATEADLVKYQKSFFPVIPPEPELEAEVDTPEYLPDDVEEENLGEAPVGEPSPVFTVPESSKSLDAENDQVLEPEKPVAKPRSRGRSRCPRCGRVKSKNAEYCKQCSAEMKDDEGI